MEKVQQEASFEIKKSFFNSGVTRSLDFRKKSLEKLKAGIKRYEKEVLSALRQDMGKPEVEAYTSEIGFLYKEIDHVLQQLSKWAKPKKHRPSFVFFPSSAKVIIEPLGVVLIIGPWNYPFQLMLAPLIPAIAAGNCAVLKPSEETPATAFIVEKIIKETFEEKYISVIQGEGAKVVPLLLNDYRFDHVFFTGSIPVGKKVAEMAARKLTPVTLELGGKSPAIVDSTANIKVAAKRISWGKFFNAGQTCVSPDYVLVHRNVKDALVDEFKNVIKEFFGVSPKSSRDFGKIVNLKRFKKLKEYLKQGNILTGGEYDEEKLYISPTIIDGVSLSETIMQEEIFGPILPILTYESEEQILEIVQKNSHPLALYLFTEQSALEKKILNNLQFGGGCINNTIVHLAEPDLPFGGIGKSGYGSYHGRAGFDIFSHKKSILKTGTWFDSGFKYPPYSPNKLILIRKLFG